MNFTQIAASLVGIVITTVLGIIGFFLKRIFGQVDQQEKEIEDIKKNYATKKELDTFRGDLRDGMDTLSKNIEDIKDNYIKKDDFVRAIADTNNRLERIYNYLLDMNGGKRNG